MGLASQTSKTNNARHIHGTVGSYVQRLLLVDRERSLLDGSIEQK
jgi:hypothetical protein